MWWRPPADSNNAAAATSTAMAVADVVAKAMVEDNGCGEVNSVFVGGGNGGGKGSGSSDGCGEGSGVGENGSEG